MTVRRSLLALLAALPFFSLAPAPRWRGLA